MKKLLLAVAAVVAALTVTFGAMTESKALEDRHVTEGCTRTGCWIVIYRYYPGGPNGGWHIVGRYFVPGRDPALDTREEN